MPPTSGHDAPVVCTCVARQTAAPTGAHRSQGGGAALLPLRLDRPRRMGERRVPQGWSGAGKAGGVECTPDGQRAAVSPSQATACPSRWRRSRPSRRSPGAGSAVRPSPSASSRSARRSRHGPYGPAVHRPGDVGTALPQRSGGTPRSPAYGVASGATPNSLVILPNHSITSLCSGMPCSRRSRSSSYSRSPG